MSDCIRIATRKGLFTVTRRGGHWTLGEPAFLGDPVTMVLDDARDGMLYAALNLGHFGVKLKRSSDEGRSWDEIAAPSYPPQPADAKGPPWKLVQIWSLEAHRANRPDTLWAGTIPGGLFRSTDRGDTWELIRSLWDRPERLEWFGGGYDHPGIHSIAIDPRPNGSITIGVSCGGVWTSDDEASTWRSAANGMRAPYMPPERQGDQNIQDPHRVVRCLAQPDVLWAQHHSGIYRSADGGAIWNEIDSAALSPFGFTVAVHPREADTAWFVPALKDERRVPVNAQLAVTRTRDGGRSFDVLREGLPQEACYDLVYRHGLDVAADGKRLAMASTTGGLWVSENEGDSWQCISTHLPPVYAVRFAA